MEEPELRFLYILENHLLKHPQSENHSIFWYLYCLTQLKSMLLQYPMEWECCLDFLKLWQVNRQEWFALTFNEFKRYLRTRDEDFFTMYWRVEMRDQLETCIITSWENYSRDMESLDNSSQQVDMVITSMCSTIALTPTAHADAPSSKRRRLDGPSGGDLFQDACLSPTSNFPTGLTSSNISRRQDTNWVSLSSTEPWCTYRLKYTIWKSTDLANQPTKDWWKVAWKGGVLNYTEKSAIDRLIGQVEEAGIKAVVKAGGTKKISSPKSTNS